MTTAAVVAYYSKENLVRFSYAGHPPALYRRADDKAWTYAKPDSAKGRTGGFPVNIPLAVDSDTLYEQFSISMYPGDRLFVYTDGIIDAPDPAGESFGFANLKETLDANAASPLSELKSTVLKNLQRHTKQKLTHDDLTLIAIEIC